MTISYTTVGTTALAAALAAGLSAGAAGAATVLTFDENSISTENTGASALATFNFADEDGDVRVDLTVDNTTGGDIGGYLTAIAFGLPDGTSYANDLTVTGSQLTFASDPSVNPFDNDPETDDFAIGFGTGGDFEGGGNPAQGIAAGSSGMFSFLLDTPLAAAELDSAFQAGFADGSLDAAVRFRGLADGGSDKMLFVPDAGGGPEVIPLPAAGWLLLAGVAGLGALRRRR